MIEPGRNDIYTWADCPCHSWLINSDGCTRVCKIRQPGLLVFRAPLDCRDWVSNGECPKGFQS